MSGHQAATGQGSQTHGLSSRRGLIMQAWLGLPQPFPGPPSSPGCPLLAAPLQAHPQVWVSQPRLPQVGWTAVRGPLATEPGRTVLAPAAVPASSRWVPEQHGSSCYSGSPGALSGHVCRARAGRGARAGLAP